MACWGRGQALDLAHLNVDKVDATLIAMAANPALLDRTVEEFRRTLTEIGGQPSSVDDAEVLGRRAAMVVLAGGAWKRALGELLTSAETRTLLGGISREALRKRVVSGS